MLQLLAATLPEQLFTQLVVGIPVGTGVYLALWSIDQRWRRAKRRPTHRS